MNCNFAQSGPKSGVYAIQKPMTPTKARTTESIAFASQVSEPRIWMKQASGLRGPRNTGRIEALCRVTARTAESPYEVLGIDEGVVSIRDIKKAYKKMARKYHPDVSPPERVDENTRRFIMVKRAYDTLSNPQTYEAGAHHLGVEEREEWKMQWQSQLDELKRRSNNFSRVSWGARMRTQT